MQDDDNNNPLFGNENFGGAGCDKPPTAPVGDTEEEVASELDTDELKSCLWVGWTPWTSNCQKHNLELGRKYRYRLCSDRGKGNVGKFQIMFEKFISSMVHGPQLSKKSAYHTTFI